MRRIYDEQDLEINERTGRCRARAGARSSSQRETKAAPGQAYRSKLEAAWAQRLELQCRGGQIARWWYEPFSLRLAAKTFYRPDFLVLAGDGLTIYEVKGYPRDDAMVKLKVAAELFPCFRFVLVQRVDGQWHERTIEAA